MYIKKLIIENFQSHEYTELEFPPGLTIIVGESDRGKSAIIRALRWVFENEPSGLDFIRAGTRNCRVTVETDQGVTVIRERTPSRNRYIVRAADGTEETFEGFRNEIPEEVIAAHGVTKARLDNDLEVSLNIAPQLDGPFLLSSPGSVKAKAIGRLYKVHLIDAAIRDTSQDLNKLSREEIEINSRLSELDRGLAEFENLPDLERCLYKANTLMERLGNLSRQKDGLRQIKTRLQNIYKEMDYYKDVAAKLAGLKQGFAVYERLEELAGKKQSLKECRHRLQITRQKLDSIRTIIRATGKIREGMAGFENLTANLYRRTDLVKNKDKLLKLGKDRQILAEIINHTDLVPSGNNRLQLLADIINVYAQLKNTRAKLNLLRSSQKKYRLVVAETDKNQLSLVQYELVVRLQQKYLNLTNISRRLDGLKQIKAEEATVVSKINKVPSGLEKYEFLLQLSNRLEELRRYRNQHKILADRISKGHEYLQEREQEIDIAVKKYGLMLQKLGKCPTCLGQIDRATINRIVSEFK